MPVDLDAVRAEHIVEVDWLESHLDDADLCIVDMRGYVRTETDSTGKQRAVYTGARDEYLAGHIPGAVYLDWTTDIVDLGNPVPAQAAGPEKIAKVLGGVGVGDTTQVIAYDSSPASQFATRLWWLLRYYGHNSVRVLNGGWAKWQREGRAIATGEVVRQTAVFVPRVDEPMRAEWNQVLPAVATGSVLLDARDPGQFSGAICRGPRAGHIPGAVHLPREAVFAADGTLQPAATLVALANIVGATDDRPVMAYCNGGVAATAVLFALSSIGCTQLTNYDGSWNEWGGRMDLPADCDQ